MADPIPAVKPPAAELRFDADRVKALLETLEVMAAGHLEERLAISPLHDTLDAIAHGINVLVGELRWAGARAKEVQEEKAAELRAAAAAAERANNAKSIFLSNMSHELRTPIAAMLGFADLLESELSPPARADLVRRLRANGQAVLSVLGDLLDLARLDANKIDLTLESVSLHDIVGEVVASVEIEARGKGLELRSDLPVGTAGTLRTDRYRLRQILVNLMANAVKFTSRGGVVVSARVVRSEDGDDWVLDVSDTGIGIAPERHPYVFELFEQADSSIARTYGGVGLGLALSRRLAAQLGGTLILLRSIPGEGTTFRLTVRSQPAPAETPVTATAAPDRSPCAITGLRVLVAEDHPDMQVAVRMLLEQEGASVAVVRDGREAVTRALADSFDVVLMDLRMPHMDGLEATRVLRAEGYAAPIVALTADPAMLNRVEAIERGCNECLSKPFLSRDLVATIRRLHDRR
jgi:signal transduction histidine kinase